MSDIVATLRDVAWTGRVDVIAQIPEGVLREAMREVASEPAAAELFAALVRRAEENAAFGAAAIQLVQSTRDPGVLAEIEVVLTALERIPPGMERRLFDALLDRARDRTLHHYARGYALKAALYISQASAPQLRRLQAELLEIAPTDDPSYLRLVAKIIGTLLAHAVDPDLERHLAALADGDHANDEACMQMGHVALRRAVEQTGHDATVAEFRNALRWFDEARSRTEVRIDADVYSACVEMLVRFQDGGSGHDIRARINRISKASYEYAAHLVVSDRSAESRSWIGSAAVERMHWILLGTKLGSLELSFSEPAWLEAVRVIEEELLVIYSAGHTLFRRTADGGLEEILRPRIASAMMTERSRLFVLEQWIERNAGSDWLHDAVGLKGRVTQAIEASLLRNPTEAAGVADASAAILRDSGLPNDRKEEAERLLALLNEGDLSDSDPIVCEMVLKIIDALRMHPDFINNDLARALFTRIIFSTVRFADSRANLQRSQVAGTDYLFDRDMTHEPPESFLQCDYFGFLIGTQLAKLCNREAINVAGGRADIFFHNSGVQIEPLS